MRTKFTTLLVVVMAAAAFGAAGDVIRSFQVSGQPSYGIRGVAKDWSDGNIWAAGPNTTNSIMLGKFDASTGSLIGSWMPLSGAYWVFDIGYGYMYGGNRVIIQCDQSAPIWRMWTTTGSYIAPFGIQPPITSPEGIGCDWGGTICFATDYYNTTIYRWNGSAWGSWATNPAPPTMGNEPGWGRFFVVTSYPDYKIYEYLNIYGTSGSLNRSFALNGWPSNRYMVGLAIGRVDATGSEESVFIAVFNPAPYMVYEVSVGDITGTSITPSSLGKIKALYN